MSKKNNKKQDVVNVKENIKELNDVLIIRNEREAHEALLDDTLNTIFDDTIETLSGNGFYAKELKKIKSDIVAIIKKNLLEGLSEDETNEEIARLVISKLAPQNRIYTDEEVDSIIKTAKTLTPDDLNKIGITRKELKAKVFKYAEYVSNEYGFIKEKLQNKLYKFMRDNWNTPKKEFDKKLRLVMTEAVLEHYKENKDERLHNFLENINTVKTDDIFNIPEKNKKVKENGTRMYRTNPELESRVISNETKKDDNGHVPIRRMSIRDSLREKFHGKDSVMGIVLRAE